MNAVFNRITGMNRQAQQNIATFAMILSASISVSAIYAVAMTAITSIG